jgi:hypothetical protein
MTNLGDALVTEAAQQIVKALVSGLVEAVKKIPKLWRDVGDRKERFIRGEIERSSAALRDAGANLPIAQARQEGIWEGHLRDLLIENPAAVASLRDLLEDIKQRDAHTIHAVQDITASGQGAIAQGAMFGNVINYGQAPDISRTVPPRSGAAE